jgi:hypothetical protein
MLEGWHYQNAYICDDIEAAIELFRKRAPIGNIPIIDVEQPVSTPNGMKTVATRLAFIWLGDLQYELIQVIKDEAGIYANCLSNGGPLRFHHVCMRVEGDWDSFRARAAAQDFPIAMERANEGDALKFLYLDAREFCGHYLEYVWTTDERFEMMRNM